MSDAPAVWVDGRILAADEPAIPADDQGFLLGLAVFETILQEDGRRFFEAEHVERLERGAAVLGIPWPPPRDPRGALADFGGTLPGGAFAVRLSLTRGSPGRGPRMVIGARAVEPLPPEGITVAIASHVKPLDPELEGTKSTSRVRNVLAREEVAARGAWDALIRTSDGDLAEGTVSNLFVARGDTLVTPPQDRGVLAGIVRGEVIDGLRAEGCDVREERVEPADLEHADEVFLSNSLVRIAPVRAVLDVREDLPGAKGEWARRALAALRAREERAGTSPSR